MLARSGFRVVLVDPHAVYPPNFRCEKLDDPQVQLLERTGLAEVVLPATTFDGHVWTARQGDLIEKRPSVRTALLTTQFVNCLRAAIPPGEIVSAKSLEF
jgi:2-polyprenyl-6-methoxyphenol hydroxylase-like FAD-dependent oxidoreductase